MIFDIFLFDFVFFFFILILLKLFVEEVLIKFEVFFWLIREFLFNESFFLRVFLFFEIFLGWFIIIENVFWFDLIIALFVVWSIKCFFSIFRNIFLLVFTDFLEILLCKFFFVFFCFLFVFWFFGNVWDEFWLEKFELLFFLFWIVIVGGLFDEM